MRILSPAIALGILVLFCGGIFAFAKKLQAPHVDEKDKDSPYFCGEVFQPSKGKVKKGELSPEYRRFFAVAFLFTIMEIGALVLGTIPRGLGIWFPLGFLGLMLLSVTAILVEVFEER